MPSQADLLAARVKAFANRVVKFVKTLPYDSRTDSILRQLIKSASAESANYRASRRSRSRKEYVAKLGTVAEEADESEHWLEVMTETELVKGEALQNELAYLLGESRQLRAIFVKSAKTARANLARLRAAAPAQGRAGARNAKRRRSSDP